MLWAGQGDSGVVDEDGDNEVKREMANDKGSRGGALQLACATLNVSVIEGEAILNLGNRYPATQDAVFSALYNRNVYLPICSTGAVRKDSLHCFSREQSAPAVCRCCCSIRALLRNNCFSSKVPLDIDHRPTNCSTRILPAFLSVCQARILVSTVL